MTQILLLRSQIWEQQQFGAGAGFVLFPVGLGVGANGFTITRLVFVIQGVGCVTTCDFSTGIPSGEKGTTFWAVAPKKKNTMAMMAKIIFFIFNELKQKGSNPQLLSE
jgi:hypothetical protein